MTQFKEISLKSLILISKIHPNWDKWQSAKKKAETFINNGENVYVYLSGPKILVQTFPFDKNQTLHS